MLRSVYHAAAVLAATVFTALIVTTGLAAADTLDFSDPTDGATLDTPPAAVTLVFGENVNPDAEFNIIGPDGAPATAGKPTIAGLTASISFKPGPIGPYTVNYKVLSSNGTPFAGTTHFTLRTLPPAQASPPTATATATVAPTAPTVSWTVNPTHDYTPGASLPLIVPNADGSMPRSASSTAGGGGWWPWAIAAALVILAAAAAVFIVIGRRRRARS